MFVLALGLLLASSTAHAQQQQEQQQEQEQEQEVAKAAAEAPISIVTYLGNDFILKDGCPQVIVDTNQTLFRHLGREREKNDKRAKRGARKGTVIPTNNS